MDAIVTAGGIPKPGEPLYDYTLGASKALLDIGGKPMIQWVLDALQAAETIERIVIIGLPTESGLTAEKICAYLPNQGTMLDNIRFGVRKVMELNPQVEHVLLVSSDIPSITPQAVDWMVNTCMQTKDDIYYIVIQRQVMEKRFPDSRRTYTKLRDVEVCGGDMNMIRASLAMSKDPVWDELIGARKTPFKQAAIIGFDTLILLLMGFLTLNAAVQRVVKRLKVSGRPILSPYAELGMDVDKPGQLELLRADLARRSSRA